MLPPVLQSEGDQIQWHIQGSWKLISDEVSLTLMRLFSSLFDPSIPFTQHFLCLASILPECLMGLDGLEQHSYFTPGKLAAQRGQVTFPRSHD